MENEKSDKCNSIEIDFDKYLPSISAMQQYKFVLEYEFPIIEEIEDLLDQFTMVLDEIPKDESIEEISDSNEEELLAEVTKLYKKLFPSKENPLMYV